MAHFLFIDTSSKISTIALSHKYEVLALERSSEQMNQAATINITIENLLKESACTLQDIDAFCVCGGPGSYTGLRVGMSTAKGMAFALDKPMINFDRLQLIALSFKNEILEDEKIGVLLSARKDEYFWASYSSNGTIIDSPQHLFQEHLEEKTDTVQLLVSDDQEVESQNKLIYLEKDFTFSLTEWIKLANKKWESKEFSDLAYSEPFYLKSAFTTTPKPKI